jgi:hypothetical protein
VRWRGIIIYLLLMATLLSATLVKRHIQFKALSKQLAADMQPQANTGRNNTSIPDNYLYGYASGSAAGGPWTFTPSTQGPAIFLLKRGYMDDALARAVLLTEARRLNDWQYTYASVYNYDLRRYLIERCLRAHPDDLTVAWASGALSLAAGDDTLALEQLARIIGKSEQWNSCVAICQQLNVSPEHMLGRHCAALTLHGRDAEAGQLLLALHANDDRAERCYLRYLADCSRYDELLRLATDSNMPYQPTQLELYTWMYESALHDRDWLRIRTTGREKARLKLRELERLSTDYYYAEPRWSESALTAALYEAGPERLSGFPMHAEDEYSDMIDLLNFGYSEHWYQYTGYGVQRNHLYKVLSTLYGATGDDRWIAPMMKLLAAPDNKDDYRADASRQTSWAQLARAYCLRGEYGKAAAIYRDHHQTLIYTLTESAVVLLSTLASGESIPANDPGDPLGQESFDADVNNWLKPLRDGDLLVALLRSPQFRNALKQSGRDLDEVLPEIRAATSPQRGTYYDSSNGELVALRKRFNLPTD